MPGSVARTSNPSRARRSSPPPQRVGNRLMSWLEEVQTAHSPAGSLARDSATTLDSASAVNGEKMNGKLKVSCSSSPWPWKAARALRSPTQVSPSSTRGTG